MPLPAWVYESSLWKTKPRRFRNIESVAQRKLQMLEDAVELRDLASPPGNRLEALKDDRKGQRSPPYKNAHLIENWY
jgi:plasmid maintenance system killer protein